MFPEKIGFNKKERMIDVMKNFFCEIFLQVDNLSEKKICWNIFEKFEYIDQIKIFPRKENFGILY